jgi:hypothetical protein
VTYLSIADGDLPMNYRNLFLNELVINRANDRHGELENETAAIAWLFNNFGQHMCNLAKDIVETLEPFLKEQKRTEIKAQYQDFLDLCDKQLRRPADQSLADKESFLTKAASYKLNLKEQLYNSLFPSS